MERQVIERELSNTGLTNLVNSSRRRVVEFSIFTTTYFKSIISPEENFWIQSATSVSHAQTRVIGTAALDNSFMDSFSEKAT
jgi:hypothetical protein